jgi:energy-converting hydrogenase Eha subunit A
MVVKPISLPDLVKNRGIEKSIEKQVNLSHPCIAAPIALIFRIELSGLRELKIVELFVEAVL